jgi:hypothetical protein
VQQRGAGREAAEDFDKDMAYEASHCILIVGGLLHFEEPTIVSVK